MGRFTSLNSLNLSLQVIQTNLWNNVHLTTYLGGIYERMEMFESFRKRSKFRLVLFCHVFVKLFFYYGLDQGKGSLGPE